MLEFTRALYELFVKQKLGLSQSVLIMSRKPGRNYVSRAAGSIYASLEKGNLFSNALRSCQVISFDDVYISFIRLAEKNGDLKSAVLYLKEKLEREAADRKRLFGASIYPVFVVIIAIAASIFIGLYTKTADLWLLMKYVLVLTLVCGFAYFVILKMLETDVLCESFIAVDFLVRNGIEISEAVACAIQMAGPSSKIGRFFENARIRLSYGMDLQTAFGQSKIKEAFYYADYGGSQEDIFGRIAANLSEEKEKRRTVCLALLEPLFIVITGVFILVLLMTFFMPLINGLEWL